jgi:hypothetical protein
MAVGGVGRGGGAKGPKGAAGSGKASGAFGPKVTAADGAGKAESLVGVSGAAGSAEAASVAAADPITAGAQNIAKALAEGKIGSKAEATQKLISLILEKKGLSRDGKGKGGKKLVEQIADTLEQDPRLAAALERTWARAFKKP